MKKRKALGKGLNSLIPDSKRKEKYREVDIDLLSPNRFQPRKNFDEDSLKELSDSIKEYGIVQPIIVNELENGKFEIIAGERRWRAALLAGLKRVPIVVKEKTEGTLLELALIENIHREDLSPIEEAEALKHLSEDLGLTHEEIGKKMGKSRAYITNMIRILNLPDEIKEMLESGTLKIGQVRPLISINDKDLQLKIANEINRLALNSREVEKLISKIKNRNKKRAKVKDPFIESAEEKLTETLLTKVEINKSKKGGKIVIKFHSDEELERLFEILLGK